MLIILLICQRAEGVELEVDKLVNEEEKQNIIEAALESLHKWRGTDKILNG